LRDIVIHNGLDVAIWVREEAACWWLKGFIKNFFGEAFRLGLSIFHAYLFYSDQVNFESIYQNIYPKTIVCQEVERADSIIRQARIIWYATLKLYCSVYAQNQFYHSNHSYVMSGVVENREILDNVANTLLKRKF